MCYQFINIAYRLKGDLKILFSVIKEPYPTLKTTSNLIRICQNQSKIYL